MKTSHLRVNQLSDLAYQKYLQYLEALDKKDIVAYGKFLADNVSVQFNNDVPMIGKENVLQGLGYYWQTFGTLEHELINIYGTDKTFVLEAKNYYVRKDGKSATVNAVAFTDLDDKGLVNSVRIYQDVSPVFK
jgi:nicotinic acid phosphoribosyltransferase